MTGSFVGDDIDDPENSAKAAGEKFQQSHSDVAEHKTIDAQFSEKNRNEEQNRRRLQFNAADRHELFLVRKIHIPFQLSGEFYEIENPVCDGDDACPKNLPRLELSMCQSVSPMFSGNFVSD